MRAKIYIRYKDGILDPQGTTVGHALNSMGYDAIHDVSVGKFIEMNFNDVTKEEAERLTDESCRKLLSNPNTESYKFEIVED
ncbi:MAG: phosphoribosylformylglycinamidine synthase subunit PurS [Candidatus Marinimicrobia bacterium]|jgi:phosphoribosylformylglycinamidine synthase|nr:phosphoribosylformylglycinamidine synthase subunit PurS [Candidatus Neomarinimicrobiota bacterium]MBT5956756.1 phosphoribosylformylglycinamidine synthase subunit PurS [Candidatus Neomarinimicrobiota bacterium]MBT6870391.1 phosphoribosylformylglycinamidine synthase subunit PurS [Candidatus Neomarinimicrobiota bacterium]MBT7377293.1 phosphoribosylformylglycinamidine synthase subunit PurS [Candidatus Neomarinimicrobiota bacterium]|tara:strand:- start:1266 stop:1511 length:246 start_codon:yes stop_codon:yes gene_type:complete